MHIVDTTPILRGAKIMLFLLAVVGTASLITIQNSRPTHAESLLTGVICIVGGLLNRDCPAPPAPTHPTQPQPQPQPQPAPEPSPSSPPPAETPPVNDTTQPIAVNQGRLAQLPAAPSAPGFQTTNTVPDIKFPSHTFQPAQQTGGSAVLGSAAPAIEASGEGWRFFGIQWYWWLLSVTAVLVTAFLARPGGLKSLINIVK